MFHIGIIGCGKIAQVRHIPEYADNPDAQLTAFYDLNAARAQELAERYGCVAVLKGSGTLIAAPGREMLHNPTGNPGLARGGSGDVLAGMLAALLAQGLAPFDAAACAVWLHGAAADCCAAHTSQLTMLPHDILTDLADVVKELTGR